MKRTGVRRLMFAATIAGACSIAGVGMASAETGHDTQAQALPKSLEITFALSALPAHLRADATVYILDPKKGFGIEREGTNGFHAFVARTSPLFIGAPWTLTEYPKDMFIPISFDSAGVDSQMKVLFDIEAMRAQGVPSEEAQQTMEARYQEGYYPAPPRTGVAYMLSPIIRVYATPMKNDAVMSLNVPHYMFYAPNITNEDIGGVPMGPHGFVLNPGPFGFIIMGSRQAEIDAINAEYEDALNELRDFNPVFSFQNQEEHEPLSR